MWFRIPAPDNEQLASIMGAPWEELEGLTGGIQTAAAICLAPEETARALVAADEALGAARSAEQRRQQQKQPVTEADLTKDEIERATQSPQPLAMAMALHGYAMKAEPQRDMYIDPATGYCVFTEAYLKRKPCCSNGCRHCPWGYSADDR